MNLSEMRDTIERLHWRIRLLMDELVWSDQLLIALHHISVQTKDSYVDLLEESATILAIIENNQWTFSTPPMQPASWPSRKAGTRLSREIAALFR